MQAKTQAFTNSLVYYIPQQYINKHPRVNMEITSIQCIYSDVIKSGRLKIKFLILEFREKGLKTK